MSWLQRIILLMAGATVTVVSVILVSQFGIPDRLQYTAEFIEGRPYAPEVDAAAPLFSTTTYQGTPVSLDMYQHQVVIINFWATWCIPCRVEMQELQSLYSDTQMQNVEILAINMGENPETIAVWQTQYDFSYPLLTDTNGEIAELYHLRGQPSTYIVDRDGIIRAIFFGATDASTLNNHLQPYVNKSETES